MFIEETARPHEKRLAGGRKRVRQRIQTTGKYFFDVNIGILSVKKVWVPLEVVYPFLSGPET